jgi:pyochelin synthetase
MNEIIERCRKAGIRLWAEDGALRYDAPKGAMTPELATNLKAHKPALVKALAAPASTETVDANRQDWGAMPTAALLQVAEAAGMAIRVDGGKLLYEIYSGGPKGLWNEIRSRKAEILAAVPREG